MGLLTAVKFQTKKWSKRGSEYDCSLKENIDLPNGVTLKGQKRKHHKLLPKFFSSMFKSKYNAAIEATNKKNLTITENSIRFTGLNEKFVSKKILNTLDPEQTVQHDDLYDSEKTIHTNNITYLKYPFNQVSDDYESTVGTVVSDTDTFNPTQVFLTRKTINLKGRKDDTIPVLTEYLAEIIRSRLPNLLQEATTWNLLYSMDQHGARLSTLYRNIKEQGPCVVVLKNSENEVFGAFVSEPFDPSSRGFFGTPECFLWKSKKYQFKKYSATGLNQYFMLADPTFIAMGGGNGNFGLYLDEDIQFGYTSTCDTFDNEILTEDNEFECYGCEIWGFEY